MQLITKDKPINVTIPTDTTICNRIALYKGNTFINYINIDNLNPHRALRLLRTGYTLKPL